MDTSKEYIQMCEKAAEIQAIKKKTYPPIGKDYWAKISVWLPRQDQLQAMVEIPDDKVSAVGYGTVWDGKGWVTKADFHSPTHSLFLEFAAFALGQEAGGDINGNIPEYSQKFTTGEQLWLAFVMKEKYQKHWNGSEWVNHG